MVCIPFLITLSQGQTYAVFGGWILLYKELIMAEYNSHMTIQRITAFSYSLGVLADVSVV